MIFYKITPSWHGSDAAGTPVKVLFVEDGFVWHKDSDGDIRVLSKTAFAMIYAKDKKLINPFFPYDYSLLFSPRQYGIKEPLLEDTPATWLGLIGRRYYKIRKFLCGS